MTRVQLVPPAILVAWGIAAAGFMAYGTTYFWPDFVHINYGFPLTFATHTLNTFIGPVDKWSVDFGGLAVDVAFWSVGAAVVFLVVQQLVKSRNSEP